MKNLLQTLASWSVVSVGALFCFSALTKVLDPIYFIQHVSDRGLIRDKFIVAVSAVFAGLQVTLGALLILRESLQLIIPVALITITGLLLITLKRYFAIRTGDCGCYGGIVSISAAQSIALDVIMILALLLAHASIFERHSIQPSSSGRTYVAIFAGALAGNLFILSYRYYLKYDRLALELSPIRTGKRWKQRWLGEVLDLSAAKGEKLLVFLGARCPICKVWAKVLNVIHKTPGLPDVIAVVGVKEGYDDAQEVEAELQPQFPLVLLSRVRLTKIARSPLPMALLVTDGIVTGKWNRKIPEFLIEPLRRNTAR